MNLGIQRRKIYGEAVNAKSRSFETSMHGGATYRTRGHQIAKADMTPAITKPTTTCPSEGIATKYNEGSKAMKPSPLGVEPSTCLEGKISTNISSPLLDELPRGLREPRLVFSLPILLHGCQQQQRQQQR